MNLSNKLIRTIAITSAVLAYCSHGAAADTYALMKLHGSVNPIMAEYLESSIQKANQENAKFIVIQMDTPGGLMNSMRKIIQSIMQSKIPVIVYAFPRGAQAASAGGFIMLSSDVAAMSPGSEIGAMHPVSPMLDFMQKDGKGGPAGVMEKKVLNDTVAYARSLAQKRNRNVEWAEQAVKDAISSTYLEAKRAGVIDIIAEDMDDLMKKLDNRAVEIGGRRVIIRTENVSAVVYGMDWKQKFMNFFADPQIMLLLIVIALLGIGLEIKNPGMILPGVLGTMSLLIFLLVSRTIPVNIAGIALIVLSVVLFVLELKLTSFGLLTLGGIVSFVLGAMILFPGGRMPILTIIAALAVIMVFIFFVVRAVIDVLKSRVTTGSEGLKGEIGEAIRGFHGRGKIMVHGEIWNAVSDEDINANEEVIVTSVEGMTLHVAKNRK